jgi:hypothetical protein
MNQLTKSLLILALFSCALVAYPRSNKCQTTVFIPMNLSCGFCLDAPSRCEATDRTLVTYKGEYYIFASKSGGYFHSTDLINCGLIKTNDLLVENYAPTVVEMQVTLFFIASKNNPPLAY